MPEHFKRRGPKRPAAIRSRWLLPLCGTLLLVTAGAAQASNSPDLTLDTAASYVAGHAVTVWCETDWAAWLSMEQQNGVSEAGGFTHIGTPVVYVAPDVCEELHALIDRRDVGSFFAADAVLTLAHEAVHQRGVADEGAADCAALSLVKDVATTFFGIPKTVPQRYIELATRRVAGKRVRVPTLKTRQIINPYLVQLQQDAQLWHDAKPAAYRGSCG
ncbi:MAG: hypothetical protein KGL39_15275 [Patescibacteria group bacterium]|nr:hypothetical protein [Patescibacteria group bacterium]